MLPVSGSYAKRSRDSCRVACSWPCVRRTVRDVRGFDLRHVRVFIRTVVVSSLRDMGYDLPWIQKCEGWVRALASHSGRCFEGRWVRMCLECTGLGVKPCQAEVLTASKEREGSLTEVGLGLWDGPPAMLICFSACLGLLWLLCLLCFARGVIFSKYSS